MGYSLATLITGSPARRLGPLGNEVSEVCSDTSSVAAAAPTISGSRATGHSTRAHCFGSRFSTFEVTRLPLLAPRPLQESRHLTATDCAVECGHSRSCPRRPTTAAGCDHWPRGKICSFRIQHLRFLEIIGVIAVGNICRRAGGSGECATWGASARNLILAIVWCADAVCGSTVHRIIGA
jgi:hypothetical protein